MEKSGCTKPVSVRETRIDSLSFSSLPDQSQLFTEYQNDPLSLTRFYPSAVASCDKLAGQVTDVLSHYETDRNRLCDTLLRINTVLKATPETAANIDLLRDPQTVAVLTGQQTGFLTGPIYSIYKALSAVKMAECLRGQGVKAVPVFWMATEDHDLDEVSNAFVIGGGSELVKASITPKDSDKDKAVGSVVLDGSVNEAVGSLFDSLPQTEFTCDLRQKITTFWRPGTDFGAAFGSMLTEMLGKFGLIVADPLDQELKRLAAPIYSKAVLKSEEIVSALRARSDELVSDGYHAQVLVEKDYFPLFWHTDDGRRVALRRTADGSLQLKGERRTFAKEELAEMSETEPARFSPGVMLRPVVQDYLFPTICYFGGGAEIAYFAQNSEVYRSLERPVTPVLHRQSFTIVERKHARTLEKYGLEFSDLFRGEAELIPAIVDGFIDPATSKLFADSEEKINTELNRLDQALSAIDVTLAENLATRRRKIIYHIAALRKKYQFRRVEIDEIIDRRVRDAFVALLPNGHLQERTLNVVSFLDRFGPSFIDIVYDSIDLDDSGHRVIYF